jgi:hypothetical protein
LVSLILSCQKLNPRLLREVTYYHWKKLCN